MTEFTDVACPACGCVCDDLTLRRTGDGVAGRVEVVRNACPRGTAWFEGLNRPLAPAAIVDGRECPVEEGVASAADLLRASQTPLIYGLAASSTPGQRAAIALAERLGGCIDLAASAAHRAGVVAYQQAGISTSSLGEVKQRADLVLFWRADPATTHPRFLERFVEPASEFLPGGRRDRRVIVLDTKQAATGKAADESLIIEPGADFELISALRLCVAGLGDAVTDVAGLSAGQIRGLSDSLTACRYGALFFGGSVGDGPLGHQAIEALTRLAADLQRRTRFVVRGLGSPPGTTGAENVLCWQTGYPCMVDFRRAYPRSNSGEFSADGLLSRGEVDCCLIVGSDGVASLSEPARKSLEARPVIVLDPAHVEPCFPGRVRFGTAVYGVHAAGTAYRLDDVAIPLRKLWDADRPGDAEVLSRVMSKLAQQ